jgi:hypothetical protein
MVIDELIINLGIDSSKFTEGQRDALAAFKKTQESAETFGKNIEAQGMKLSEVFGVVKKGAMGIVGAFVGGEAAAFIDHIIGMDAATGRMAKTIGTSVENLGIWQSMIRQVGGSAEDATSALSALQATINNVRSGNGMFDNQFGFLLTKIGGAQGKNADQIMRELQKYFAGEVGAGRMSNTEAATQMSWVPGMNQSLINLLLDDFKKIEAAARAIGGASNESAKAAELLQSKFSLIIQAFERFGASMIPVVDLLMKPINQLSKSDAESIFPKVTFDPGSIMDRFDRFLWGDQTGTGLFSKIGSELSRESAVRLGKGGVAGASTSGSWLPWGIQYGFDLPSAPHAARLGGASRGDRNNNPGNMKYGPFAQAHGATGQDDRGFAIFPSASIGGAAQIALVSGSSYSGLTLDQFAAKYAEGSQAWERTVGGALGIGGGDIVNNQDPRLIDAIRRAEGTGGRSSAASRSINNSRSSSSTSSSEVHIGNINVNAPNATDADGIAKEIGPAMKRSAITSPANSALV